MKILNESAFNFFLLICIAFMVTCIGSAAAMSSATQEQAGYVSVTNGDVSCGLGQQQSAEVSGDGVITQDQQSSVKTKTNPHSGVIKITVRLDAAQNVDTSSTSDSTNNKPTSNVVEKMKVDNGGSGYIDASQLQTETSAGDISQQQTAVLKIKETPNGKIHAKLKLQQK
ncbi:MAG: hypothetical protein ACOX79_06255 [Methanosarcina sp.]